MAEKRIALGIVGASARYGWGMRAHLPAFLALPEYELVAVCTAHQETAEESAQRYGARKAYSDYHDLVSDPEIEVVDVCIRAPSHYEVAMAALKAGKHVFCEWPLGANSAQADEMAALASAKGVRTMVGLQSRYAPSFQHLRQLVDQGYLGQMLSANMTMFLPETVAGKVAIGADARIVLDARPDLVIPAKVSFVSPRAQFTPKEVETRTEREKLMFRIKVQIDPQLLKKHEAKVKTGLPGVAYVRLDPSTEWPEHLHVRLPQ